MQRPNIWRPSMYSSLSLNYKSHDPVKLIIKKSGSLNWVSLRTVLVFFLTHPCTGKWRWHGQGVEEKDQRKDLFYDLVIKGISFIVLPPHILPWHYCVSLGKDDWNPTQKNLQCKTNLMSTNFNNENGSRLNVLLLF